MADLSFILRSEGQCHALPHEISLKSLTQDSDESKKSN